MVLYLYHFSSSNFKQTDFVKILTPYLFIIGHVAVAEQFWCHVLFGAPVSVQSPWGVELRHTVVG